jgi:hypothetical protein
MRFLVAFVLGLIVTGCVSQDYVGERFAPTQNVQVFYDTVPAGFRVMGEDRAQAGNAVSGDEIIAAMVEKAREVGADAIVVTGVDRVEVGQSTNTFGSGDRDDDEWRSNSYSTTVTNKVVTAKFLKRDAS